MLIYSKDIKSSYFKLKGTIMTNLLKNGNAFTIRKAMMEDSENVISYVKKIVQESDNLTFEKDEFNPTVTAEREFIESINKSTNQCFLIAVLNDKIIGNLSISNIDRARIKHSAELSITVLKNYWNQGVASNLMAEFIQWLKTTNLTKINLTVKEDNIYAIKLYEKFGFVKEGVITREFFIDGKYYNSIFMGLQI
jgi:RimJ/RimL family protein N-acetyltransferase